MKIPYKKEWHLFEREDYANYLFVTATWEAYPILGPKWGFKTPRYLGAEYINSACNLFALKGETDEANKFNFGLLLKKPILWDDVHLLNVNNSNKLFDFGRKTLLRDSTKLSDEKLANIVDEFNGWQIAVHEPRGMMWMLETPDNIVTEYLMKYLSLQKIQVNAKTSFSEAFQMLIAVAKPSLWSEERMNLAKIGLINNRKKRNIALGIHARKSEWLEYGLQGKILDLQYFTKELEKIMSEDPRKVIKNIKQEFTSLKKKQLEIQREYKINSVHKRVFKIVRDSNYARLYSKYSQFFGYYAMEGVYSEIGKRAGLSLEQIRFLGHDDFRRVLIEKKDFSQVTLERMKYSLHITDGKGHTEYFFGDEARKVRARMKFKEIEHKLSDEGNNTLRGQSAYNGKVQGRVKVINLITELGKIHHGNILVSHMTNPDIVPAMKMARAIVTDLGGITCHAAIVARELKKPCIIGTKIATKVLKDGDMIEVDADNGIVRIIK